MKRKAMAAALSVLMLTSAVSCGSKAEKSGNIKDVASAAKKYIDDDYSGIIASDAKYSLTDSESMTIRRKIRNKANYDSDWIIIADDGDCELFYADGWNKKAKGYKGSDNDDGLTLKELYDANVGSFKDAPDLPSLGSYVKESKRESYNTDASTICKAVKSAFTDLEDNYDTYNIGYIVFENGSIAELNYKDPTKLEKLTEDLEKSVNSYFDMSSVGYAVVFCSYSSVSEVYISDSANGTVNGEYPEPYDDSAYDEKISDVFEDNKSWYEVEVKSEKDINDETARNLYYTMSGCADDAVYYNYRDLKDDEEVEVKAITIEAGKIKDIIYTGGADKNELIDCIQSYYDEEAEYYADYYPEVNEVNGFALLKYNYVNELYIYDADGKVIGSYPSLNSEKDLAGLTVESIIADKAESYGIETAEKADDKKTDKDDAAEKESETTEAATKAN